MKKITKESGSSQNHAVSLTGMRRVEIENGIDQRVVKKYIFTSIALCHQLRFAGAVWLLLTFLVLGLLALAGKASAMDRFVSLTGGNVAPFTNWVKAATNIQIAIDAAVGGETVWVTNGVYTVGGRVMAGNLTNRVALTKALALKSVNGPAVTVIQGAWHPGTTNGTAAVRCAWLTNNAALSGFTLRNGATRSVGDYNSGEYYTLLSGGGAWCADTTAIVTNCLIVGNASFFSGGGVFNGTVQGCVLANNTAFSGDGGGVCGGVSRSVVSRCLLTNNYAGHAGGGAFSATSQASAFIANLAGEGGGAYGGSLFNCTLTQNSANAGLSGGGVDSCAVTNCIIFLNTPTNYRLSSLAFTSTWPLPVGPGNLNADPQLMDGIHIATTSPCRGSGNIAFAPSTDFDSEAWTNPPSMGCDEVWESGNTGSLAVSVNAAWPFVAEKGSLPLAGQVFGRASRVGWNYGDGAILTNASVLNTSHVWTNAGDYVVTFTAFNADNINGTSTNLTVHVVPLEAPAITVGALSRTNFNLSFPGQPGVTYVVQQTTNIALPGSWQTVRTVTSTGSVMQIVDTKATNAMRFYRAGVQ